MLDQIALKVANNLVNEGEKKELALDPSTLFTLIELVSGLVEMFKDCRQTASSAKQRMTSPSLRDKLALRLFVRRELGGRRDFKLHNGDKIVAALIKTGNSLTQDEVDKAFYET